MPPKPPELKASASDSWLRSAVKTLRDRPKICPVIGVVIECRMIVKRPADWEYVNETLDKCREYGYADVSEYKVFED